MRHQEHPNTGPRSKLYRPAGDRPRGNDILASIFVAIMIFSIIASRVMANDAQPAAGEEVKFNASVVAPAVMLIKKALPPAPPGWVVAGEMKLDPAPEKAMDNMKSLRFSCSISYKRVEGLQEERKRLDDAYRESSGRHGEAVKPLIEELLRKQTQTSLRLRKAMRRKNQPGVQQLNGELDENGRTMRALHEETDRKIAQDLEGYLIKDAEASIRVSLDDSQAELQHGEPVSVRGAAFALRREGGRTGVTDWNEGRTLILYGDWQQEGANTFRRKGEQQPFASKTKTVQILMTGDQKRVEQLLKKMDVKAILSLMK